jgi:enamine deaminase RidA (YjgF/YER057c/UK114 family)
MINTLIVGVMGNTLEGEQKMEKIIYDIKGFEQEWGYAGVVEANGFIFVSGMVSISDDGEVLAEGDMAGQMRNVYSDIRRALDKAGAKMNDIVKETIHTTDLNKFIENKDIRTEFFMGYRPASGAWHEVSKLAHPSFLFEVDVIAVKPQQSK